MKNVTELASAIAKKEGLKKQVVIGNVREILGILSDMIFNEYRLEGGAETIKKILFQNGNRRWRVKGRK